MCRKHSNLLYLNTYSQLFLCFDAFVVAVLLAYPEHVQEGFKDKRLGTTGLSGIQHWRAVRSSPKRVVFFSSATRLEKYVFIALWSVIC